MIIADKSHFMILWLPWPMIVGSHCIPVIITKAMCRHIRRLHSLPSYATISYTYVILLSICHIYDASTCIRVARWEVELVSTRRRPHHSLNDRLVSLLISIPCCVVLYDDHIIVINIHSTCWYRRMLASDECTIPSGHSMAISNAGWISVLCCIALLEDGA